MVTLIKQHHNTYTFLFSSVVNKIHLNPKESEILSGFIKHYELWARYKGEQKRFTSLFHLYPLQSSGLVEAMKIDPAALSEAVRKDILKK